jgi:hypothetical protein
MPYDDELEPKDIQGYLVDVKYPASGEDLVEAAKGHGAPHRVVTFLERIPSDSNFDSKTHLMQSLPLEDDDEAT